MLILMLLAGVGCQNGSQGTPSETQAMLQESNFPTIGTIERLDPALDELVSPDATMEIVAEGFDWSEGPVWIPDGSYLLFSDIPPNSIFKWTETEGAVLWLKPSGYTGSEPRGGEPGSNGLILDHDGNLVMCQHGDRQMARLAAPLSDPAPEFETIADQWEGKRFNSPNDAVYHSSGALYFTDPPYGLVGNVDDPSKEIPFQGVYRVEIDGEVTLLTDQMTRPNGLAFSPDENTLYVANSDPDAPIWMAYDVREDGGIENGRVFFDATDLADSGRRGLPDGMKVDAEGNIYATGPGGLLVFTPEGTLLGTLLTTQATSNCAFGEDGSTLFLTADSYLLRVRLNG